jgi:hypothetical protein
MADLVYRECVHRGTTGPTAGRSLFTTPCGFCGPGTEFPPVPVLHWYREGPAVPGQEHVKGYGPTGTSARSQFALRIFDLKVLAEVVVVAAGALHFTKDGTEQLVTAAENYYKLLHQYEMPDRTVQETPCPAK